MSNENKKHIYTPDEIKRIIANTHIRSYVVGKDGHMGDYLVSEDAPEDTEEDSSEDIEEYL